MKSTEQNLGIWFCLSILQAKRLEEHPFDTPSQMARRASFRYSKPNGSKSILSILQAKWLEEHPFNKRNLYAMPMQSSFDARKQALAREGSESYLLDIAESRDHVVPTIYFKTARCTADESMHLSLATNPAFDHLKFDRKTSKNEKTGNHRRHLQV
jgi:hypothetical protein